MKQFSRKHTALFTVGTLVLTFCAFVLAGCALPLLGKDSADSSKAIVTISIGPLVTGARTVYPSTPEFTNYRLSFTPNAGQTARADVESTTSSVSIALATGSWTITAYGYASFNSASVVVAQGSVTITATEGVNIATNIDMSANISGGTGKFRYTVEVPVGVSATTYQVTLQQFGQTALLHNVSGTVANSAANFSYTNSADFVSGYYLATVRVNNAHSAAVKQEIVHIYPNMTSPATFAFTAADFLPMIQLSGTASVNINGTLQNMLDWGVSAYTDLEDRYGSEIGYVSIPLAGTSGVWSMLVEPFASATDVFYILSGTDSSGNWIEKPVASPGKVGNADIAGISLVSSASFITLSGTLAVTVSGTAQNVLDWEVSAFTDVADPYGSELGYTYAGSAGAWSMLVDALDSPVTVHFRVKGSGTSTFVKDMSYTATAGSVSVGGIPLAYTGAFITLGGTMTVKINKTVQDMTAWRISAFTDLNDSYGSEIGFTTNTTASGVWTMTVPPFSSATTVHFNVDGFDNDDNAFQQTLVGTCQATASNISAISVSADLVALNGTLSGSIDGTVVSDFRNWYVIAYTDPNDLENTYINECETRLDGSWSMVVPSFAESTTVYFYVQGPSNRIEAQPVQVFDENIGGIGLTFDLGTVEIGGALIGFTNPSKVYAVQNISSASAAQQTVAGTASVINNAWSCSANEAMLGQNVYFIVSCSDNGYYRSAIPLDLSSGGDFPGLTLNFSDMVQWNPE